MWRAEPKRRGDRTLYEQIRDTRPDEVRRAALAEAAAAIHDADIWEVADALDVIRALRSKAAAQ